MAEAETVLAIREEPPASAVRVVSLGGSAQEPRAARSGACTDPTHASGVRVIVRDPARRTSRAILERRLAIARALVRAHRRGVDAERIRRLDAAYLATRMPLDDGESYDE